MGTENLGQEVRTLRDIPTRENSWISNRKLQIVEGGPAEKAEGQLSMAKAGTIPPAPPRGRRSSRGATVTSKTALPYEVTERQFVSIARQELNWAVNWHNRGGG